MANIPVVIFKYSWIYDQTWKEGLIGKKSKKYPSSRRILNYIKKVEKLWRKEKKRVLLELSKITHLGWKSKVIYCYVVGRCRPFSDPLTMPIYEKYPDYFIDVLTHELIHQLFIQNEKELEKSWHYIWRKYKRETDNRLQTNDEDFERLIENVKLEFKNITSDINNLDSNYNY